MNTIPPNKPIHVEDIMSRTVLSLHEQDTIDLGRLTMDVAMVRHMPVTDSRGKLIGIVALTDLLQGAARALGQPVAVRTIMKTVVHTIHRRALAEDAARTMLECKVGCLPVLGEGDSLVGMLTETDFLRIAEGALRQRNLS